MIRKRKLKTQIIVFCSLLLCLISSCLSNRGFPIKEGKTTDIYIDKENHPYLYIDSKPHTKTDFINGYGLNYPDSCLESSINMVPNKWIEIYRLNNQYYFHLSFGQGGLNKLLFCDNNFYEIIRLGDHPDVRPIIDFKKKSENQFTYVVADRDPSTNDERGINFYVIDEENQIAIVEDTKWFEKYRLMIAQKNAYNIPVLINYCKQRRLIDFKDFDTIDYEETLREKGFK